MNLEISALLHQFIAVSFPLFVFSTVFLVGYTVRKVLFKRLSNLAQNTTSPLDDVIISATKEM